ncbi:Major Facilitator Superfamily transporter [Frankia sp. EI5c]|uniref:MFS transporter n=1 Tax=Frankia sp. EI5c TaxID=683316 RepID=UPI0007C251C2|nr:MFS transporter [Frankia sp. EI5c]OAA27701.1 Major Facilitator Superfamily transporter [Frankia sp. EI5c]
MVSHFVLAALFASWAPRIPQVKEGLDLTDGQLGLALLGGPVGALATLWFSGVLVGRLGSRTMVRASLVGNCLAGTGLVAVSGVPSLFAVLAVWCALTCALDLASNAQAAMIEDLFGRRIMMTVHAAWTGGALVGAGLGAGAAALDVPLGGQLLVLGTVSLAVALPATGWMLEGDRSGGRRSGGRRSGGRRSGGRRLVKRWLLARRSMARWAGPFAPLCLIAFASYLGEGIAADWSAVYLTDVTGASPGLAGVGLVTYMTCMLGVRLLGDRVVESYGVLRTVRPLTLAAAVMFAVALLAGPTSAGTAVGIAGFAALGAGLACVVPAAFSAAGQRSMRAGAPAGPAIALVSALGYSGWLAGPPLIGGLAELVGLRGTMWVVVGLTCAIAVFAGALEQAGDQPAQPAGAGLTGAAQAAHGGDGGAQR